ncbi:polynucleotide 5'-hydroxyl-kinase grc3 [Diplogelasinospora grovesii]|uniref:Polynucleotide 5'-hydroxyl-kinase GRC3 n=1 Tax=Diplogelasinospora grovesii TaxID=303347 RepID=A0AAN6N8Y5_9PEZI|nr:polynucleotide 5'-hydroxyl-kinase grc3 [Diplogelasinospora grovesii]
MATNKKRRLEINNNPGPGSPVMSAFAARQSFWPASAKAEKVSEPEEEQTVEVAPARRPSRRKPAPAEPAPQATEPEPVNSVPSTPYLTPRTTSPRPEESGGTPKRPSVQHSSFKPTKKNYQRKKDGRVLLKASEGERLVILGSYGLKVVEGEAAIAGAILTPSDTTHWIHAPHCHALPVLRITSDSTIELHPHPAAPSLRQLGRLNPVFGRLWSESDDVSETFQIVTTSEDAPAGAFLQTLVSPAEWNKKLAELSSPKLKAAPPIVFVCGPKSAGKSTFGRLLANRLVTDTGGSKRKTWPAVAVLDLDPGQPEYSPPGVISLNKITTPNLSPSFCHPLLGVDTQLRSHATASVSPSLDPAHFVECVLDLYTCYKRSLKIPLVINTPGWIQGTGLEILTELVKEMRPTEVVYMSLNGPDETVDALRAACTNKFQALPSQGSESYPGKPTPLHLRTMQMMSYFHLSQNGWDPAPLMEIRPWRVRYRGGGKRGFKGVLFYDNPPPPDLVQEAINGMVLGLVRVEDAAAYRGLLKKDDDDEMDVDTPANTERGVLRTKEGIPLIPNPQGQTLDPRHSRALGLVLIRGIDTSRGELQLLTPIPIDRMTEEARSEGGELVLVAGKWDTPTWAYAEDLHRRALTSSSNKDAQGDDGGAEEAEDEEEEEGDERSNARTLQQGYDECPWVETLHGSSGRAVGSRVWRVRRDLGRN